MTLSRRNLLLGSGALLLPGAYSRLAHASTSRAMTLAELKRRSRRVAFGRAVLHECAWERVGPTEMIVTKTRFVQEHDWLTGLAPGDKSEAELMIWTLGGRVGSIGQKVHGEAQLTLGEPALVFVGEGGANHQRVMGMSQGHYRIESSGTEPLLRRSAHLPSLVGPRPGPDAPLTQRAAVDVLHDCPLGRAFEAIRSAR